MKKRHSIVLLSIALVGIVAVFWHYGVRQRQITYQGLTISQWLERGDATTPLEALGTNLLPVYINVLKQAKPRSNRVRILANRILPGRLNELIPVAADEGQVSKKYVVLRALPILNCHASPAMPYVFDLLRVSEEEESDPRVPLEARELFLTIQCKDIMEQLIRELDSNNPSRRADAAYLLIEYRRAATNAIPSLVKQLARGEVSAALALAAIEPDLPGLPERLVRIANSTNLHITSRHACVKALSALGPKAAGMATQVRDLLSIPTDDSATPKELRPMFSNEKWRTSVITALGNMGRGATIAVPQLEVLLTDTNCAIRVFAARAIWQITEDPSLVIPILKATLGSDEFQPTFEFDWAFGTPDPLRRASSTDGAAALYRIYELGCRDAAAFLLGEIGPEGKDALSVLAVIPTAENTTLQLLLARAQARITKNHTDFVRLLLSKLDSNTGVMPLCVPAAYFLGELGADADSAIPQLEVLARDKNQAVRTTAEHALTRIRRAATERGDRSPLKK